MKILHTTKKRARGGFTLAEMMVVIVIIGLLATLVVPNVIGYLGRANTTKIKADIQQIVSAINNFELSYNRKPESLEELTSPPDGGPAFLNKVPKDPYGMAYGYEPPSSSSDSTFRVFTLGKDKSPGGEGDNADLDNIKLFEEEEN
ncbi:MAG: type II secretion system major pseudopilin GspG [Planctomycetota bacterium]